MANLYIKKDEIDEVIEDIHEKFLDVYENLNTINKETINEIQEINNYISRNELNCIDNIYVSYDEKKCFDKNDIENISFINRIYDEYEEVVNNRLKGVLEKAIIDIECTFNTSSINRKIVNYNDILIKNNDNTERIDEIDSFNINDSIPNKGTKMIREITDDELKQFMNGRKKNISGITQVYSQSVKNEIFNKKINKEKYVLVYFPEEVLECKIESISQTYGSGLITNWNINNINICEGSSIVKIDCSGNQKVIAKLVNGNFNKIV